MTKLCNILYKEQDDNFYVYFENYIYDCCCMWNKDDEHKMVYSIERLDILPRFRRRGLARKLLNNAIEYISAECPQACIEITAKSDEDSEITTDNLVTFYESVGFELYQKYGSRILFRRYLDETIKPEPVFDNPSYFRT